MKWWWKDKEGSKMSEEEFLDLIENTLCADFVEYLEIFEDKGYYIPFITTVSYLTHPSSKTALKLKDNIKLKN